MVNILVITEVLDGLILTPYIFSRKNLDISEMEDIKAEARRVALACGSPIAKALPAQTVVLAEQPFPCYAKA